ncbi:hypothetical protein HCN51_44380 [Nonomuraea sp. FMUSA5-5]|uniref:Reverse transcriptase domain-containing protein n=1 Tax=Nonomuraea composti TaxID=2720023 RepID=A0ABX1BIT1_9ACTN|nr:hypothetical protein [Nonomuraea sp. FMUSA5-5]
MSAGQASPAVKGSREPRVPRDPVRALQHALYRAAKADPGRRFHALFDKVFRRDVLQRAWVMVRRNNGAPDIDKTTLAEVEEYGIDRLLGELAEQVRQRRYRPLPARRVLIPKPGSGEMRPLSIPAVRDRIVQAALKIVLEPVFEADMADCSFGFRPRRSAHDALQVLIDEQQRGRRWMVETGHRQLLFGDPAREVDAGDRGTHLRPAGAVPAAAGAAQRGADRGRAGAARGHRDTTGRRDLAAVVQHLPAPARPGLGSG